MSTSEERLEILKMIQAGKISAEQGAQMLEDLRNRHNSPFPSSESSGPKSGQWFRVVITDVNTGKQRVNLRMPVNLVNAGMKMGARFSQDAHGISADELASLIRLGEPGKIFDLIDDEKGEHIQIFIE